MKNIDMAAYITQTLVSTFKAHIDKKIYIYTQKQTKCAATNSKNYTNAEIVTYICNKYYGTFPKFVVRYHHNTENL